MKSKKAQDSNFDTYFTYIITKVVKISNPFTVALAAVFFALFYDVIRNKVGKGK